MMNQESSNLLKDSFFAKRVLDTIRLDGTVDDSKIEIFNRVLKHLETIKNGRTQIQTGNLADQPVKSIIAYRKAIGIIADLPCDEEKNEVYFDKVLEEIRKEVMTTLDSMSISADNLKFTAEFFREARKLAVQESAREAMGGQELATWQTPMQF